LSCYCTRQQLLKYTPEDHEDYNKLKEAYEKMYRLAEFINEKKREVRHERCLAPR